MLIWICVDCDVAGLEHDFAIILEPGFVHGVGAVFVAGDVDIVHAVFFEEVGVFGGVFVHEAHVVLFLGIVDAVEIEVIAGAADYLAAGECGNGVIMVGAGEDYGVLFARDASSRRLFPADRRE